MSLLDRPDRLNMLEKMLKIRLFEEKFCEARKEGILDFGQAHLGIGEEAMYVGICTALEKEDLVIGTHRSHGYAIAKGSNMNKLMAELFGKSTGVNHGKGGTLHFADASRGVLGASGIVGGGVPIGVGAALAIQMKGKKNCVVAFFGDGAANEGIIHESMNLASIWKLPILFVCENNEIAISVPIKKSSSVDSFVSRAVGYNMPGIIADGQDVEKVRKVTEILVKDIKQGTGPAFIECKTERICDHCGITYPNMSEKIVEVNSYDIEYWTNPKDPIVMYINKLCSEKLIDMALFGRMYNDIKKEVDTAVKFSVESDDPCFDDLYKNMFTEEI